MKKLMMAVCACVYALGALANTYYVTPNGTGNGSSWESALGSVQSAIDAAGTEPSTVYLLHGDYPLSAQLSIATGADLAFIGGCTGEGTAVGTEKSKLYRSGTDMRILSATSATLSFANLAVADGQLTSGTREGHGLWLKTCTTAVANCEFTNNGQVTPASGVKHYGGAIFASGGSLAVSGSYFTKNKIGTTGDNSGSYGGAICTRSGAALTVTGSTFAENICQNPYQTSRGGAIDAEGGTLLIDDCLFQTNRCVKSPTHTGSSYGFGGNVGVVGVTDPLITNCTFQGGYCVGPLRRGGCLYFEGTGQKATVENCRILDTGKGPDGTIHSGSVYLQNGTLDLVNCLITRVGVNNAVDVAGGTLNVINCTITDASAFGIEQKGGTVSLVNSVVWGCTRGFLDKTAGTMTATCCDLQNPTDGEGNLSVNPIFVDPSAGDFTVPWYSPLVDRGTDVDGLVTDLVGNARPQDGNCTGEAKYDIGCYEAPTHSVDLACATMFSKESGMEPLDVTVTATVGGTARQNLTYKWTLTRTFGSSVTKTESTTDEPELVLPGLEAGTYVVSCEVRNGDGLTRTSIPVNSLEVKGDSLYVTPTGAGAKDGSSWADALPGVAAAVARAGTTPSKIRLLAGDYELSERVMVDVGVNIALIGGHTGVGNERGTEASVIKPVEGVRTRLFSVEGTSAALATAAFDGVTLAGGSMPSGVSQYGMAIYAKNAALAFADCVLEGNGGEFSDSNNNGYARYGGAIYLESGSLTATGTEFRENYIKSNTPGSGTSAYGGALYLKSATVALTNNVFKDNYLLIQHFYANGGAIDLESCPSVSIVGCAFTSNHVQWAEGYDNDRVYGGTLYASGCASLLVEDCTFTGSWINSYHNTLSTSMTFGHGGTMYLTGGSQNATIRRTTVVDCGYRAAAMNYDSGAVTLAGGTLTMENVLIGHVHGNCFELRGGTANVRRCTFAGAEESRGAQGYGFYHATGGTVASFTESILSGNVKGGYFVNSASPATFTYCCLQDNGEGLGNFSDDPLFADTTYFHLKSQAGRYDGGWFAGGAWVTDDETSPALDRGNPASEVGDEPQPNRHLANVGYDAGLSVATKTYLGEPAVPTALAVYLYPLADITETTARAIGEVACADGGEAEVTVCWGAADGGDDLAAWDKKIVCHNVADWTLVERTVENADGRTYVRLHASDGASTAWSATESFVPALPPELADVSISHLTRTSFRAHGTLTGDGGIDTRVRVRYWTDDEGAATEVWYNEGKLVAVGTTFTILVKGLEPGVVYHYAIEAVNSSGVASEPTDLTTVSTNPIVAYVTPEGAGVRDGSSWANAFGNLQDAIDICVCAGDLICLKSGEYLAAQEKDVLDLSHYIVSGTTGLTIRGGYAGEGTPGAFADEATVLRRDKNAVQNAYRRIFHAMNATLTLENLTITEGSVINGSGHGLLLATSATTVRNCVFRKNGYSTSNGGRNYGGAIHASGGSLAVEGCTFDGNLLNTWNDDSENKGGAIYATGVALSVTDSDFIRNWTANMYQQTSGGAIYATGGSLTLENSTFHTNCVIKQTHDGSSSGYGGTLYLSGVSAPVIRDCTFQGGYTAASFPFGNIYLEGGSQKATIERCKFLDTGKDDKRPQAGAPIRAGGIRLASGSLDLRNCLIARIGVSNAVDVAGGTLTAVNCTIVDVAEVGVKQTAGTASVTNSIVWNCGGGATTGAVTLDHCCTAEDPLLYGPTKKRAYHLRAASPCTGAGDATVWMAADTDLDGLPRIKNGKVDLGCYSFDAPGLLLMVK